MFINIFKYRRIFFVISLLILFFSCKRNNIELKNTLAPTVYHCKIFSSSNSPSKNLFNNKLWYSSKLAKDDFIIFAFDSIVFIDKIIINQSNTQNFDRITKIRAYSNNGFIGDFIPENIKIKQKLGFLILKIEQTKGFQLTNFYKKSIKYSIAFVNLNNYCSIKKMDFFKNDSCKVFIKIHNQNSDLNTQKQAIVPKIVDYSFSPKSFLIKTDGEIFGFCRNYKTDTIYHGFTMGKKELRISKLIFSKNKFHSKKVTSKYSFKKDILSISQLPMFRTDFENDFFVDIKTLDTTIVEDIRYATTNNFTGKVIYDCPKCLMRYGAAKDFVKAEKEFISLGYRIKVFDCYRPHSAQYKLWEIMPNKNYVANPDKGSIHNRGAAVDMTLVDSLGNQLDMGSSFDFFGTKAFSTYTDLSPQIIKNRQLMWNLMHKYGFREIKTEWWHLYHYTCMRYPISDEPLPCK